MGRSILPGSILACLLALAGVASAQTTGTTTTGTTTTGTTTTAGTTTPPPDLSLPPGTVIDGPGRIGGIWKFNKDLSTDTSALDAENATPSTARSGGSGSGGGGGGGSRRGGLGGFGRGGGGGGASHPSAANQESQLQMRALMREAIEAPLQVTIVSTADSVMMTDDQGTVRKFTTNGKKEQIDLGTAQVDSVSKWDGDVLDVELTGGSFKLTETYQVSVQGHALIVELKTQGGNDRASSAGKVPIKRIYDKADAGRP